MKKRLIQLLLFPGLFFSFHAFAQSLTVEKIMRDPKWMGVAPSGAFWGEDSRAIYFNWNPAMDTVRAASDSVYSLT